jgi:ribonuclease HI
MTSSKKPVENRELWEALLPFLDEHDITFYRVKGHINVDWHMDQGGGVPDDFLWKTYRQFCEWNGTKFLFEQFVYITRMNNRADALANEGMDQYR